MKAIGTALFILGIVFLAVAGINASKAPDFSYLIGTFLPGLLCLIVGLKLRQTRKTNTAPPSDRIDDQ